MKKIDELSPLALAFMGDAVHTAYVRKDILSGKVNKISNYHTQAKNFCNAKHQKEALEQILPTLNDEEKEIVRKARNCHSKHSAKNFDEETYKKATAFEALIGFLFLTEKNDRLEEILKQSMGERE
ncbi:MAG: Mini-ribonuclease 3 [Candidatus Caccovivens sp.]